MCLFLMLQGTLQLLRDLSMRGHETDELRELLIARTYALEAAEQVRSAEETAVNLNVVKNGA